MAQIQLKKLTGIQVESDANTIKSENFKAKVEALGNSKLVFAGQDYKGTLQGTTDPSTTPGTLELYLKGPENYLKIEGITVKSSDNNALSSDARDATIEIEVREPKITERNSDWLATQLNLEKFTASGSSIKFGEWNDYDLSDKCYVDISFA